MERDWDLLRQCRLERGLPPAAEPLQPARSLLVRGVALGGGVLAAVLGIGGVLLWRQAQLNQQLEGLRGIPVQVQALEGKALGQRRRLSAIQRSNEGLAKGLVAVSSGSALLAQLTQITPQGVQLTDVQVQAGSLKLKGVAADPQAFRRVNGLSLLLAESPLFQPKSVKVVKLSREASKPAAPVDWDLTAAFATLPAPQQLRLLQSLGSEGLAKRLQILERAGVLP
ncbi:MAG: PilN domain-containing protein [Vulcanococcus sp. Clear-D1]|nr:PilN domain-containing protein [Vulcanococcus sp. Clear-D1]